MDGWTFETGFIRSTLSKSWPKNITHLMAKMCLEHCNSGLFIMSRYCSMPQHYYRLKMVKVQKDTVFPVSKRSSALNTGSQHHHVFRLARNSLLLLPSLLPFDEVRGQQPVLTELHWNNYMHIHVLRVGAVVGCWTCDWHVAGSNPSRWLSHNIGQLSLASLRGR